jgi:outer membrane protein OmpA-like peptidoglycan-associated protein
MMLYSTVKMRRFARFRYPLLRTMLVALVAAILPAAGPAPADVALAADRPPRVVGLPAPPPGPRIRRVGHDAGKPVVPGAKVVVTVETEPKMTVTAALGTAVSGIPCPPVKAEPGTYTCEVVVPESGVGVQRVKAIVADAKGRSSTLSAPTPVIVEKLDPWKEPNALNVRLVPAFFAAGSAELDDAGRADLAKDAEVLKAHAGLSIVIEGHCDKGETGDLEALSTRRAEAARDRLAELGVPKERMTVKPLAATQPVSAPMDEAGRALNRRAMILFEPAKPVL